MVATLSENVPPERRGTVADYVDGVLRAMPEHLRLGVAGESVVLGSGAWLAQPARFAPELRRPHRGLGAQPHRPDPPVRAPALVARDLQPRGARARSLERPDMTTLETEILIIGSGAGGAVTAATLARAGRSVMVVEEGPWVDPDLVEPFSLDEMVLKYRHQGASAALGTPGIAYAEGPLRRRAAPRSTAGCTTGSRPSSPRSGAPRYRIAEFTPDGARRVLGPGRERAVGVDAARRAAAVVGGARARRREARLARGRVRRGSSSTTARAAARSRRWRARSSLARSKPARRSSPSAASRKLLKDGDRITGRAGRAHPTRRHDRVDHDPRRSRLRVRRRDPDADAAAAQRHPGPDRHRPEVPPDDQGRGPLPQRVRPRRRPDAPGHGVLAVPHDRRLRQPPGSRRARTRRLVG